MDIKKLAVMVHETSVNNGWWPENKMERSVPEMLLLLHRNVSKATDAYRNQNSAVDGYDWRAVFAEGLADVAIQIMDMCEGRGVELLVYPVVSGGDFDVVNSLMEIHYCISRAYANFCCHVNHYVAINISDAFKCVSTLCENMGIDLESAIIAKHEINKKRTYRHGNKAC